MKSELEPEMKYTFDIVVSDDMRPQFDGEFVHNVLSTVTMVYFMERAGRLMLLPYLDDDEDSAGYGLNIKHVGPAITGQTVTFTATCTEVSKTRVVCYVKAATNLNVVGEGVFTQAIFPKDFMEKRIEHISAKLTRRNQKANV